MRSRSLRRARRGASRPAVMGEMAIVWLFQRSMGLHEHGVVRLRDTRTSRTGDGFAFVVVAYSNERANRLWNHLPVKP